MIATVSEGKVIDLQHHALDTVRWTSVEVDATPASVFGDVVGVLGAPLRTAFNEAAGRALAVRLTVVGTSLLSAELELRQHELRDRAFEIAASISDEIWIERVRVAVAAPPIAATLDQSLARLIVGEIAAVGEQADRYRAGLLATGLTDVL